MWFISLKPESKRHLWGSAEGINTLRWPSGDITARNLSDWYKVMRELIWHQPSSRAGEGRSVCFLISTPSFHFGPSARPLFPLLWLFLYNSWHLPRGVPHLQLSSYWLRLCTWKTCRVQICPPGLFVLLASIEPVYCVFTLSCCLQTSI